MASETIPSWFNNLPSWIQSGRDSWNTNEDHSSRISPIVSASTRTKRKSRAEAMRKLEGRKLSESTTLASNRVEDSESEDDDPWTDPWQWQKPPNARRNSSVYSDAQELGIMHKYFDEQIQNPFVDEDQQSKKVDSPGHIRNPFTEEDDSSRDQKQDLELQVRHALRQSHTTELTHPPIAYSILSRRFSLTPSDTPYRLSWLHSCPADEYPKAQRMWRGASRSYDSESRSEGSVKEAENLQLLGWRFGQTAEAPKSVSQTSVDSPSSCTSQSSGPLREKHDSDQIRTTEVLL